MLLMSSAEEKLGESHIRTTVKAWRSDLVISEIRQLTSDASPRRYFRVYVDKKLSDGNSSLVAMVFDSLVSPDSGKSAKVNANRAVHDLTQFLVSYNVPVPALYYGGPDDMIFLIEDIGDTLLAHTILEPTKNRFSEAEVDGFFNSAIEELANFQTIPPKPDFFPYQREFVERVYFNEAMEFMDYVFKGVCSDEGKQEVITKMFEHLAKEVYQLPRVLSHRDYHCWNLMVDYLGRLRIIDFQDALMAPMLYDFIPLLNDRDTDAAIGIDRYKKLVKRFYELSGKRDTFFYEYDRVLLQRDFKVAGRFNKLAKDRGLVSYLDWVPGTIRRLGRTLERMSHQKDCAQCYKDALSILCVEVTGVAEGAQTPLRLG